MAALPPVFYKPRRIQPVQVKGQPVWRKIERLGDCTSMNTIGPSRDQQTNDRKARFMSKGLERRHGLFDFNHTTIIVLLDRRVNPSMGPCMTLTGYGVPAKRGVLGLRLSVAEPIWVPHPVREAAHPEAAGQYE